MTPNIEVVKHRSDPDEIYDGIRARWSAFDHCYGRGVGDLSKPAQVEPDPRQMELPFPPDNLTP